MRKEETRGALQRWGTWNGISDPFCVLNLILYCYRLQIWWAMDRDNKSPPPSSLYVKSSSSSFSHDDISAMPENPPKNRGHRRAHSEIITLPDDLSFDADLLPDDDNDLLSLYLQFDQLDSSSLPPPPPPPPPHNNINERSTRVRHQHSHSMDGSIHLEMLLSAASAADDVSGGIDTKKAMSADKLAELALVDPKRAKR